VGETGQHDGVAVGTPPLGSTSASLHARRWALAQVQIGYPPSNFYVNRDSWVCSTSLFEKFPTFAKDSLVGFWKTRFVAQTRMQLA
jgi:hypothetical protein